jgi:hypothetical protein
LGKAVIVKAQQMYRPAVRALIRLGALVASVIVALCSCGGSAKPLSEQPGSLPSGRYVTDEFEPAFSFEVGEGWEVSTLQQKPFVEVSRASVAVAFNNPPSHVNDPTNPDKLLPAPEDWVSWFQEHPHLETSEPLAASVGGVEGRRFDTRVSSLPRDYYSEDCLGYGVPLWPLLNEHHWCADEGDTARTTVLKVEGETVIVDVYSESETFKKVLPEAREMLETVKWEGE